MRIESVSLKISPPDISEVKRYMRAGKADSDGLDTLISGQIDKVYEASAARACYIRLPLAICGDSVKIGNLEMKSNDLRKRLDGCQFAYIFAATVGSEVDRIIRAASVRSGAFGLAADAAGSAAVEEVCDELCRIVSDVEEKSGFATVTRFSCGYGDLSLEYQKDIIDLLQTQKHIGVCLLDGGMMTPTKSVTAIVGIKNINDLR